MAAFFIFLTLDPNSQHGFFLVFNCGRKKLTFSVNEEVAKRDILAVPLKTLTSLYRLVFTPSQLCSTKVLAQPTA